jgi:hypothetical protein
VQLSLLQTFQELVSVGLSISLMIVVLCTLFQCRKNWHLGQNILQVQALVLGDLLQAQL